MINSPPLQWIDPHRAFSGIWLPEWLKGRSEISPTAKLLYAELCRFAGHNGMAWPSYGLLARHLCVSRRHVMRLLSELTTQGLVAVTRRRDQDQGNGSNIYRFLWHPWMQQTGNDISRSSSPQSTPIERKASAGSVLVTSPMSPAGQLPSPDDINVTTPSGMAITTGSDKSATPLVTKMSPKENHKKRIIKKCPKGASSSSTALHATTPCPDSHRLAAAFEPVRAQLFPESPAQGRFEKPTETGRKISSPSPRVSPAQSSHAPKEQPMNSALTRKAWVLTRRLLGEFWDNCKIKPDTRILYGYVDRSLRSGFHESDILSAFERALHECHGHATDVGQVWEASSTAHRAEALLKRCQGRWRPLTADEQAELRARIESSLASGSPPVAVEPVLTPLPEASRNSSRKKENEPIPPEQWPSPTQIRATFNAFRQAAGLPTRRDIP